MCKVNPITKEHIEQMKSSFLRRLDNPNLTDEQRRSIQSQYDYLVENAKEKPGVNA